MERGLRFFGEEALYAYLQMRALNFGDPPTYFLNHVSPKGEIIAAAGFSENWSFLSNIAYSLHLNGYNIHFPGIGHNFGNAKEKAQIIIDYIKAHKLEGAVGFAHSLGSIELYWALEMGLLSSEIAISPIFAGVEPVRYIPGDLKILLPDSMLIKHIRENTAINQKVFALCPDFDGISGRLGTLPGAENKIYKGENHFSMLLSQKVAFDINSRLDLMRGY
jgi:hypothetical protein